MSSRLKNKGGIVGLVTGVGLLAIAFVGNLEGLRLYAYQDVVGVWTACYGETAGIHKGMRFTKDQCDVLFIDSLAKHEKGMRECLLWPDELPDKTYVAMLSFTYNIGIHGFCRSHTSHLANKKQLVAACHAMMGWIKPAAIIGRRKKEVALCLAGLKEGTVSK